MNSHEQAKPSSGPRARNIRRDSGCEHAKGVSYPDPPTSRDEQFDDGVAVADRPGETTYYRAVRALNADSSVDLTQTCVECGVPCRQRFCLDHARLHTQEMRRTIKGARDE